MSKLKFTEAQVNEAAKSTLFRAVASAIPHFGFENVKNVPIDSLIEMMVQGPPDAVAAAPGTEKYEKQAILKAFVTKNRVGVERYMADMMALLQRDLTARPE